MNNQPFVINIAEDEMPNMASENQDEFSFEFNKTNLWTDKNNKMLTELREISNKLDIIIEILEKGGK